MKYLDFAVQFTPQYGDSFLEIIRLSHLQPQNLKIQKILVKSKQSCLHCEPNYGVLWFYHKESLLDNAYDIWHNALRETENNSPLNTT